MKTIFPILFISFSFHFASAQTVSKEIQVKTAVMAIPESMRADATVMGYDNSGKLVVLKEGSNEFICLADNPEVSGVNIACYHKSLDPFMQRGRDLRAEGKGRQEIFDIREKEVKEGTLFMPKEATTLHILYGSDDILNKETGELTNEKIRYVVYIPFATSESTGLPDRPVAPGAPWIMDPGTHRAHIMITPVNE